MVKKVGKYIAIFCLLASSLKINCVDVTLQVKSTDGADLEQAAVGKPFVVEVLVKDTSSTKKPEVKGLDGFHIGQTGLQIQTINGKTSIAYTFNVRVDKPGVYKVGPAIIKEQGKEYKSEKVKLEVAQEQILDPDTIEQPLEQKVFFELASDKKDVVVGEKINCRFRFYYLDKEDIKLKGVVPSRAKELRETEKKGAYEGKQKINDKAYNYIEYRWSCFPKSAGIITLPAYRAEFSVPVTHSTGFPRSSGQAGQGFFGAFSSFFGRSYNREYIDSNALTFNVQPLPQYDGIVNSVGQFNSFEASVDRAAATQGDGIVYTIEIEGDCDLDSLDFAKIIGMPEQLKYYDSKQYVLDNSAKEGMKKKRFEFIVQALESGDWTIPEQRFTYFDTKKREYKTLKTDAIKLKILKGTSKPFVPKSKKDLDNEGAQVLDNTRDKIIGIQTYGQWYSTNQREISFWFFLLLMLVPLVPWGVAFGKSVKRKIRERYAPHMIKKYAFKTALKDLSCAKKKNDFAKIYSIFIALFAQRFELSESIITQDDIIKILQEKGFSQEDINNWENFVSKISSFVFSEKGVVEKFDKDTFEQAMYWVNKFKEKF